MNLKLVIAMSALAMSACSAVAVEPETNVFKNTAGKTLPYRLVRPEATEPGKSYPLVVFLHGAGERGTDNAKTLIWFWNDKKPSVLTRKEFVDAKAFAVIPQCPEGKRFVEVPWEKGSYQSPEISEPLSLTIELIESLQKALPIDVDRISVVGMSMGGYGAIDLLQRRPEMFSAAVCICGAGDLSKAKSIAKIPLWLFHGDKDTAVPVAGSRELVAAIKDAGGSPKYTEYPGVGHNSWSPAFEEKEFWTWLLAQKRGKK